MGLIHISFKISHYVCTHNLESFSIMQNKTVKGTTSKTITLQ